MTTDLTFISVFATRIVPARFWGSKPCFPQTTWGILNSLRLVFLAIKYRLVSEYRILAGFMMWIFVLNNGLGTDYCEDGKLVVNLSLHTCWKWENINVLFSFLCIQCAFLQWFAGAMLIVVGVLILSKSSIEKKESAD